MDECKPLIRGRTAAQEAATERSAGLLEEAITRSAAIAEQCRASVGRCRLTPG